MTIDEIYAALVDEFGEESFVELHTDATDPWIEVVPEHLIAVCEFLRDDERMKFEHLNDLCGVDYLGTRSQKGQEVWS